MRRIFTLSALFCLISLVGMAQPSITQFGPVSGATDQILIVWAPSSGTPKTIVMVSSSSTSTIFSPVTNTTYTANTAFGSGTNYATGCPGSCVGATYCVFNATAAASNTVQVSGLSAATNYFVQIIEYTGGAGAEVYSGVNLITKNFQYLTNTGAGLTWSTPFRVTNVDIQAWGGGASGAGGTTGPTGGGGAGGGAYTSVSSLGVSGGIPYTIGAGVSGGAVAGGDGTDGNNTTFNTTSVVAAGGSKGLGNQTKGTGGTTAACTPNTTPPARAGGNGGNGDNNTAAGGGGGSSGTPTAAGSNGTNGNSSNGGAGGGVSTTASRGNGGAGGDSGNPGTAGSFPGGGGGGGGGSQIGGAGAQGMLILSFVKNAPVIASAKIQSPSGTVTAKVGDVITVRVTVASGETGLIQGSGSTINGQTPTSFTDQGGGIYDFTYTVVNGNANWAANALPWSLKLSDNEGFTSAAFTTHSVADNVSGDANKPVISTVAISPSTLTAKINDVITFTITAGESGLTNNGSTINSKTLANFTDNADVGHTYTVTYTVTSGDADWLSGALPLSFVFKDAAGNSSTAVTSTTPANTLAGDANKPTVVVSTSASSPSFSSPVNFTAAFNETISPAFTTGNVDNSASTQTGITVTNLVNTLAGKTWTFDVGATGATGTLAPVVAAGAVTDAAGNPNVASTGNPSITLTIEPTQATTIAFSSVTSTSMTVTPSGGNGTGYVLVARTPDNSFTFSPVDGTNYTSNVNSNFTSATPVTGSDKILGIGAGPFPITGLVANTPYYFKVFAVNGTTTNSNYNPTSGPVNNQTTPCDQPSTSDLAASGTPSTGFITINWTTGSASDGSLVLIKQAASAPTDMPVNGTSYLSNVVTSGGHVQFSSTVLNSDGHVVMASSGGSTSNSLKVYGLTPGLQYSWIIYTFNTTSKCYQTTETNNSGTTTTSASAVAELSVTAGGGAEPATISSLGTVMPPTVPVAPQVNAVQNFDFTVTDAGADGVDGLLSTIVINTGPDNDNTYLTNNWATAIASAKLSDGTNTMTVTPGTGVNASDITFSSINTAALGNVPDGGSKTYTLTIALNTNMGATLRANIDNKQFDFNVNTSSFTTSGVSSTITGSPSISSGLSKNVVTVTAQKIILSNTPSTTALVNVALTTGPTFTAVDDNVNSNTDLNFGNAITVNATVANSGAPANFSSGVANLSAFKFTAVGGGSSTVSVTANSITSTATASIAISSTTTIGTATSGVAAGPNLNNGSTAQVVLGFSLVTDGANENLTGVTLSTTSDPTLVMSNFKLYSNSTDAGVTGSPIAFSGTTSSTLAFTTGVSIALSSTPTYFYVVADVKPFFQSFHPTITFSLPNTGFTVSLAGATKAGSKTGTSYTMVDLTPPTLTISTVNSVVNENTASPQQEVDIVYSESMNTATTPVITLLGSFWGSQTPKAGGTNGWFSGTNPNDTYKATFTHSTSQETVTTDYASVPASDAAQDWGGNTNAVATNSSGAPFILDNQKPTATVTATTAFSPSSTLNIVNKVLTVQATFSEAMNTGIAPTVTFSPLNAHLVAGSGSWDVTNTIYTITYTHNLTPEEIASTTASVNGGKDANGNVQTAAAVSPSFLIDTQRPTVTSINRNSPAGQFTNSSSVSYTVVFSEATSSVDNADFTPILVSTAAGSPSAGSVTGIGTLNNITFTISVAGIAGDGDIRLDVDGTTATINDANGNALTLTHNGDQTYTIDMTPPTVTSIVIDPALVNSYSSTVNGITPALNAGNFDYVITFSEKVNGLDQVNFNDLNGRKTPNASSVINISPSSLSPASGAPDNKWKLNGTYTSGAGTFEIDFDPGANLLARLPGLGSVQPVNPGDQLVNGLASNFFQMSNYSFPNVDLMYDQSANIIGGVYTVNSASQVQLVTTVIQPHPPGSFTFAHSTLTYTNVGITASTGSNTVTGSGFLGLFHSGDLLVDVSTFPFTTVGTISSVINNTTLTLNGFAGTTISNSFNCYFFHPQSYASTIVDQAGNSLSTSFFAGTYGNFQRAEPSGPVTVFNATPSNTSIKATWTDIAGADHYLVMLRNNNVVGTTPVGTFPAAGSALKDGVYFSDDTNVNDDGLMILNVTSGVGQATFQGVPALNSGASYSLIIYPYSLDNNNIVSGDRSAIDYNLTSPATINNASSTTTISSTTTVAKTASSTTIPSTTDLSSLGQAVFSFKITDDALASGVTDDNSPFKFNTIAIIPGATNALDWVPNIADAKLSNSVNGVVKTGVITGGTPGTSKITFSLLSSSVGAEGYVPDNQNVTYTLTIWLNNTLADNTLLDFKVDNTSFTGNYDNSSNNQASSQLSGASSASTGNVKITVTATALSFATQQPVLNPGASNQQYVLTNFTTPPTAKAVDLHANVDVDYTGNPFAATISTTTNGPTVNTTSIVPSAGVYTFPGGFQYNDAGTLTNVGTLTATVGGVNSNSGAGFVACNPVNVVYFGGTLFANGTSIAGSNGPATISSISASPVPVFAFNVQDDGGGGGDGAATKITGFKFTPTGGQNQFSNLQDLIASATLTDDSGIAGNTVTITQSLSANGQINTGDITFTSLPVAAANLGSVADNTTKVYTLSIIPKTSLTGGLQSTADNLRLVFDITDVNTSLNVTGSTITGGQNATSDNGGHTNDKFQVVAQKIILNNTLNPIQSYDAALSPTLTGEATDNYGTRDLDYGAAIGFNAVGEITNPDFATATFPIDTNPNGGTLVTATSGLLTFDATDIVKSSGNGQNLDLVDFTVSSSGLTSATVNGIKFQYSGSSDVVQNNAGSTTPVIAAYTHNTNILYASYQSATFGAGNTTPATTGSALEQFLIRDGGGSADADGTPTVVKTITLTISNYNYLRTVALYAGTTWIAELPIAGNISNVVGNTGDLAFSTLATFSVPDNQNKALTVYATFIGNGMVDNSVIQVKVKDITAAGVSSNFGLGTTTNYAALAANENATEVVATLLDIVSPASPASASISSDFPGGGGTVIVQARDGNANLDVDFVGKITALSNTVGATMVNGPTLGTTAFLAGVYNFATNFQFTSGNNNDDVSLTIKADNTGGSSGTNCGTNAICSGLSPTITLSTSFESSVQLDPNFHPNQKFPATIPYFTHTETAVTGASYPLIHLLLVDGSRSNTARYGGPTGPLLGFSSEDSGDSKTNGDTDGASTNLTSVSVMFSNPSALKSLGLVDKNGTLVTSINGINYPVGTPPQMFTFSTGSTLISAPDDSSAVFSIVASFQKTFPQLQDGQAMQIQLVATRVGVGSQYFNGKPINSGTGGPYLGGHSTSTNRAQTGTIAVTSGSSTVTGASTQFLTELAVGSIIRDGLNNVIGTVSAIANNTSLTLAANAASTYNGAYTTAILNTTDLGLIDVIATSLDFTTQPSTYAGILEGVGGNTQVATFGTIVGGVGYTNGTYNNITLVALIGGYTTAPVANVTVSGGAVTAVSLVSGGKYVAAGTVFTCPASAIGGTGAGWSVPAATYTTAPFSYGPGGVLTSMPVTSAGVVMARDANTLVDTGFNPSYTLYDSNTPLQTEVIGTSTMPNPTFANGVLDLSGITYQNVGNGKIDVVTNAYTKSVTLNGSTSAVNYPLISSTATSTPSSVVNVLDVTVTQDLNGVVPGSGVPPTASLKGGLQAQNIFGLKFTANNSAGVEPKLKGFTIGFKGANGQDLAYDDNGVVIFSKLDVFINGVVNNVTSIGGQTVKVSSTGTPGKFDRIFVDLSAASAQQSLSSGAVSFFLVVNVDPSTNTGTPTIIPYFSDSGWGSLDDQNTIVSNGTATGGFSGNAYSFASTKPPVLRADLKLFPSTKTRPYAGQPNVDPSVNQVTLEFDTNVGSLDSGGPGSVELWNRTTNTKVADLVLNTTVLVSPALSPTSPQQQGSVSAQNTVNNVYPTLLFDIVNKPAQLTPDEVYFVKIVQGSYDPNANPPAGHGIADYGLNFYGGISDNSTLYFKVSNATPLLLKAIKSTFNTTTVGTLATSFDQLGTAYYLVVKSGDPAPTVAEITGAQSYALNHLTATLAASGNYQITAVNAFQTYTFSTSFTAGQNYDVYVFAQNDAVPTPVPAAGIYGTSLVPNSGGPTLTISGATIAATQTSTTPNNVPPNNNLLYTLCPDSYVTITNPMIIGETASVSFSAAVDQDFNVLLPTGFEFDVTVAPTVQLLGGTPNNFQNLNSHAANFSGTDPKWEYRYVSNTVLNIRFFNKNNPTNTPDFISISGVSIRGKAGSSQNPIYWFYGSNVFTAAGNPTFPLAQVALLNTALPDFNNSFWQQNKPFPAPNNAFVISAFNKTVNAIPDNYDDPNNPGAVRLLPITSTFATGDFLASFFNGTGVSGDLLTLNAVPPGAAFNITMTHTDLNGCATAKVEQYVVYDHNSPISKKLGSTLNATTPASPAGTKQDIANVNFPAGPSGALTSQSLLPNELAGYSLLRLSVDLPSASMASNPNIPISGSAWRSIVHTTLIDSTNAPTYTWDYSKILNATTPLPAGLTNVYDYYKSNGTTIPLSPFGNNYWVGGTLGKVQFSGAYQSTADNSVYVPFRQDVELFVPAVPVIEVVSAVSQYDPSDAATAPTFNSIQYPTTNNTGGYPGTPTFCELGGTILLNGYPSATAGKSAGNFAIYDYASYTAQGASRTGAITTTTGSASVVGVGTIFSSEVKVGSLLYTSSGVLIGKVLNIADNLHLTLSSFASTVVSSASYKSVNPLRVPAQGSAFVDNGNGSMTLNPTDSQVQNGYNDVMVTYTYQDNSSPAIGTGYLVIRVTPNPKAQFTISSVFGLTSPSSTFDSFCSGNAVNFDASVSTISASTLGASNVIANYAWNFGDVNSPVNTSASGAGGAAIPAGSTNAVSAQTFDKPAHVYNASSAYTVGLTLTSNWGCQSAFTLATLSSSPPTITKQATNVLYAGSSGTITVGNIPFADFSVSKNCAGQLITFDASASTVSGNSVIKNWNWDYNLQYPNNPYNGNNLPAPTPAKASLTAATGASTTYDPNTAGFYAVNLYTITTLGCQKFVTRPISQLKITQTFSEYFDNANNPGSGWQVVDLNNFTDQTNETFLPVPLGSTSTSSSWTWGATTQRYTKYNSPSGNSLWSTSAVKDPLGVGSYYPNERTALYSPCLNLDPAIVPRPMLSFSSFVDLQSGDGLIVQYSTDDYNILDPRKTWTNLGNQIGDGIQWWTTQALASAPGSVKSNPSGFGWSGNGETDPTKHEWIHPKHSLDILSGTKPVILRFALASVAPNTYNKDGVGIDSVFFGSRTRTILFEDFVTTDAGSDANLNKSLFYDNEYVENFVSQTINQTQLVNINYHVGFNGQDPFNLDNTADPGARALFYGIKKVPYAFLDGAHYKDPTKVNTDTADLFKYWGQTQYDLNTLKLAQANFNNKVTVNPDGSLTIDVKFTPLFDLPSGVGGTTLQIAVLEKSITKNPGYGNVTTGEAVFDYVLKKMLPSAVGTQFSTPLVAKTPVSVGTFKYLPKNLHSNVLTVVIFLQNEAAPHEVYQADLIDNIAVNNVVTGIEPLSVDNISLYPNPADQELTIELPHPVKEATTLRLANQWGQYTEMTSFNEGEMKKTISTSGLAEGVYILQIGGNDSAVRAKVVVVHK